ncbi:hypothetical protein GOV12_02570 [Candidatus Pacearchaeota archaeon]|nr:hypothetical protein [Candidatus Pacearchaeota archaeon]
MVTNRSETRVNVIITTFTVFLIMGLFILNSNLIYAAEPLAPDTFNVTENTTKVNASSAMVNVTGGRVLVFNLTVDTQNTKWKAFLGEITGSLALVDGDGAKIYSWEFTQTTGRVFATRAPGSINWSGTNCSNVTHLEAENSALEHTSVIDNITTTFNTSGIATHKAFPLTTNTIFNDSCPVLNTYVNNVSQNTSFDEVALYDDTNIVYAALIESDTTGYDGASHDFQMIVPENGNSSRSVSTAYYLYAELD